MPVGAASPSFELSASGIAKESTFGAATAPTLWLACSDVSFSPKNDALERMGARQRTTQSYPATGMYSNSGSFTVEATPDVLAPLLSLAMGAESVIANPGNPGTGSPTLAYDHTIKFGSPLQSFTYQFNRVTDCVDYSGNMVSSLRFSVSPTSILTAQVSTQSAREAINPSPSTPSFGLIEPFRFEDPGNTVKINGTLSAIDVTAFDITVSSGIREPEPVFGSGRFPSKFSQGQASASGSVTLKFNSNLAYKLFMGSSTAIAPQSVITPLALEFYFRGKDMINANVSYGLKFILANCFLEAISTPGRAGSQITQSFNFRCAESAPGAADDLVAVITNTASTAF